MNLKIPNPFIKPENDPRYECFKESSESFLSGSQDSDNTCIEEALHTSQQPSQPCQVKRIAIYSGKVFLIIVAFWGLINLAYYGRSKLHSNRMPSCDCGETPQESLDMGCKFDWLSHGWLQPYCIDEELTAEFHRAGPGPNGEWPFYLNPNGTEKLTPEERMMLPGSVEVWSVYAWHLNHCFYMWRKLYRSRFLGTVMEGKYDNEFHIIHCTKQAYSRDDLMKISTTTFVYLDPDHSYSERFWTEPQREWYQRDHHMKNPNAKHEMSNMEHSY